jgi:hypothetical protein
MAQELVITSVRRGLDGGSGYQPVLRTRGMKRVVAERLALRSSYPFIFDFGDPRNPVVFLHRIETMAGQTYHLLGRICDAGSDDTGRSNFLSHLVAIDESEAGRKPAGPADVIQRFRFRTAWNDPPREADPPAVIGGDRSPGPCAAWEAAGLDPGLAGDLAEAAAGRRPVRLIVRQSDDVLSLFADAMTLVPPARRWDVTFTTCEIEPFDAAVWRAIREDLPQAKSYRGAAGVIDLTTPGRRGSDGGYARFARGEAAALPWQPQPSVQRPADAAARPTDSSTQMVDAPDDGLVAVPHGPPQFETTGVATVEPPSPKRDVVAIAREHDEDPRPAADGRSRRRPWRLIPTLVTGVLIAAMLAFMAGVVAVVVNPDAKSWVATHVRPLTAPERQVASNNGAVNAGDPPAATSDLGEAEKIHRDAEQKKKQQAYEREQEEKARRDREAEEKAAEEARRALQMKRKEEAEKAEREKRELEATRAAKQQAFARLAGLAPITLTDLPTAVVSFDGPVKKPVEICRLDVKDLVGLELSLAVPKHQLPDGSNYRAWVDPGTPVNGATATWHVRAPGGPGLDSEIKPKPMDLATLTLRDGALMFDAADDRILNNVRFDLLRRSVLLIKAKDPDLRRPDERASVMKAIQLVQPQRIPDQTVGVFTHGGQGSETWRFMPEKGPFRENTVLPQTASIDYEARRGQANAETQIKPQPAHGGKRFHPIQQVTNRDGTPANGWIGITIATTPGTPSGTPHEQSTNPATMSVIPHCSAIQMTKQDFDKICTAVSKTTNEAKELAKLRAGQSGVRKLARYKPKDFPARRPALEHFVNTDGKDFGETLKLDVTEWMVRCEQMVRDYSTLLSTVNTRKSGTTTDVVTIAEVKPRLQQIESDWQDTYSKPILEFSERRVERLIEEFNTLRTTYNPLVEPLKVRITRITCPAVADDGTEYPVLLAESEHAFTSRQPVDPESTEPPPPAPASAP